MEITLALIKPDAVKSGHAGVILSLMEQQFVVADVICAKWPASLVEQFYAEHKDKVFWSALVEFMSRSRMYAVTLVGHDAVARWRAIMGATDPRLAEPGTIRHGLGNKLGIIMQNAVHGSDSAERAIEEIGIIQKATRSIDENAPSWFGDQAELIRRRG